MPSQPYRGTLDPARGEVGPGVRNCISESIEDSGEFVRPDSDAASAGQRMPQRRCASHGACRDNRCVRCQFRLGFRQPLRSFDEERLVVEMILGHLLQGRREKEEVDRKLAELGLDGRARAETLDLEQHLRLCEAFGAPV